MPPFSSSVGERKLMTHFVVRSKKRRWVVDAISGEEMANLAKEVISLPPEVIERMKKLLGN